MATKYRLEYKDYFQNQWRVDIDLPAHTGEVIPVTGTGDNSCMIVRESSDADDPFAPLIYTRADLSLYSYGIDVEELQNLGAREVRGTVYMNGGIKMKGYLSTDNVLESLSAIPKEVTMTITDGLRMLDGVEYATGNQPLPPEVPNVRSPLRVITELLRQETYGIGNELPLEWFSTLKTNWTGGVQEDFMTHAVYGNDGTAYRDGSGNNKSGMYIMEGLLRAIPARLYQSNGTWVVERINDMDKADLPGKRYDRSLNSVVTVPSRANKDIGDSSQFGYINEDVNSFFSYGVESVKVKYDKLQYKNIVPNGSFNMINGTAAIPFNWWTRELGPIQGQLSYEPSIVMDSGYSAGIEASDTAPETSGWPVQLISLPELGDEHVAMPIDTQSLYKDMEFGFTYTITECAESDDGAGGLRVADVNMVPSLEGDGGAPIPIMFKTFPLRFSVCYKCADGVYVLNQFGTWKKHYSDNVFSDQGLSANLYGDLVRKGDIVSVNMNKFTIKLPDLPYSDPLDNSQGLYVYFNIFGNTTVLLDDVYINVANAEEVYEAKVSSSRRRSTSEEYSLSISSSKNGFYLSNLMSKYYNSAMEENYIADGSVGNLTELSAISFLRIRGRNNRIVDTSIFGNGYDFGGRYSIDLYPGKNFIETGSTFNTKTGEATVNLYEISNSEEFISVTQVDTNKDKANSDVWV